MYNGRIARFDAPNQPFTVERVHLDEVRRGEILIKVKRANICGSDLHAWHGDFSTRGLGGKFPTVLGHEMVGTIEELGDGVTTDASGKPLARALAWCSHTSRRAAPASPAWRAAASAARR